MKLLKILNVSIFFFIIIVTNANAYIDPGIFTFLWQGLIVIFITIFVFFKDIVFKVKNLLIKFKQKLLSNNSKSDK